jgi:hypothetical protein
VSLLALALLFTLLNAPKPLHIDDAAYYYYARHIAGHSLDPYGFEVFWYNQPLPANQVLAPPVLPYWWAAAIGLFGERPFWWKLWLFPFCWLFVCSLDALFRRFTPGLERPLLWMTVLSPTFLPSLNLMLDIPALALGLAALTVFMRAADRDAPAWSALAGLVAGLAMQTKYTGFLVPAAMLLYALAISLPAPASSWAVARKKVLLWLVAATAAVAVFIAWEGFVAWRYPEGSHFLYHLRDNAEPLITKLGDYSGPLLALLGGVAPVLAVLGLIALGRRGWVIVACGVLVVLGYTLIACLGVTFTTELKPATALFGSREPVVGSCSLEQVIFAGFGAVVCTVMGAVIGQLLRLRRGVPWQSARLARRRTEWFLVAWLGLEIAGYFALTPFGAVRRVMGLVVVSTLLAGRLAAYRCRAAGRRRLLKAAVIGNILLGFTFYAVDLSDAFARKDAALGAAAAVRRHEASARIWFSGHWEFQYYAERAGMRPVVAGVSRLRPGDWLVVPDDSVDRQEVVLDPANLQAFAPVVVNGCLPVTTAWAFYGTGTGVPLRHHDGPLVRVDVYRVIRRFVPKRA